MVGWYLFGLHLYLELVEREATRMWKEPQMAVEHRWVS